MAAYIDIGAFQYETDDTPTPMDIGAMQKQFAAVEEKGQVIIIHISQLLPVFWFAQSSNNRRDFMKNTLLAMIGVR